MTSIIPFQSFSAKQFFRKGPFLPLFLMGLCTCLICSGFTFYPSTTSQTLVFQDEENGELGENDEMIQIWYDSVNDVLHVNVSEEVEVVNLEIIDADGHVVRNISTSEIPSQISLDFEPGEYDVVSGSSKIIKCFLSNSVVLAIA